MGSYGLQDPTYQALSANDDSDDLSRSIAKVISPTPAAQLVGPPPDIAPKTAPGVSTPQTGTLATLPQHSVAKNMDTVQGRAQYSGISNPPDGGAVRSIAPLSAAVSPVRPTVQPVVPQGQPQPVQPYRPGVPLAAQQAQRMSAYNNSAAPAQYAARMSPVATDPANPDPNASLRPAGSNPGAVATSVQPIVPAAQAQQVNPPSQLDLAQNKLAMLTNSGPGWSQIKNPVGRVAAGIGNGILSFLDPKDAANTPGTTLHNQQLIGRQQGVISGIQAQQTAAAQQADIASQTAERKALADKAAALAQADAPQPLTAAQAALLKHPELEGEPMTQRALTTLGSAAIKGDAQEKTGAGHDATKITTTGMNNATSTANTESRVNSAQAVADSRNKTQMLLGQLRASVSTANNERTNATHETTAGMRASGGAAGAPGSYKVPADVTKRAALGANVIENADAVNEILGRRGNELLGPAMGRFTNVQQMIGSDDKDIAALGTRIHNIALAANGAHGLRSQEAVATTEKELINGFHNGPNAVKSALDATTSSVQTFINDEKNFRQTGGRVAPVTPPAGQPAIPAGNVKVQLPDGRVGHISASQLNQFVKDHPGAKTF